MPSLALTPPPAVQNTWQPTPPNPYPPRQPTNNPPSATPPGGPVDSPVGSAPDYNYMYNYSPATARRTSGPKQPQQQQHPASTPPATAPAPGTNPSPGSRYYQTPDINQSPYQPSSAPPAVPHHNYNNYYNDQHQWTYPGYSYDPRAQWTPTSSRNVQQWPQAPPPIPQYNWQYNQSYYPTPPTAPPPAAAPIPDQHSKGKKNKPTTPTTLKRPHDSEDESKSKRKKVEDKPVPKPPAKSHLHPPRQAQSAWQLFFTDELNKAKAAAAAGSPGGHAAKLNVAQIAKDAGVAYAHLDDEQKTHYAQKVQESKDQYAKELSEWQATLTPEDIRAENAFRAQQRKEGKSRKGNLKDPNAPKKPLSAYFLFLKGIREDDDLRAKVWGDESETTKQSVLAAERWRSLSDDEKKPFLSQAEKDKQDYEAARKIYEDEAAARARGEDVPIRHVEPAKPKEEQIKGDELFDPLDLGLREEGDWGELTKLIEPEHKAESPPAAPVAVVVEEGEEGEEEEEEEEGEEEEEAAAVAVETPTTE